MAATTSPHPTPQRRSDDPSGLIHIAEVDEDGQPITGKALCGTILKPLKVRARVNCTVCVSLAAGWETD